ncbi:MAG: primase [Methanothermococcus sp.]|nr:primase [Methanothermococcus sp.]
MDLGTTKYIIYAELMADGYVEKHDVIGAIFGQTEGLLSSELDLRDLQKSGRIGRIDVELENVNGKSFAKITLPSSLDKVETSILAATLETIDRVGPCLATVKVTYVEDIRVTKRQIRTEEIIEYGDEKLPAGPNIDYSDAIIVVEGRADVLNLLRCGIKNVIAVEGTSVPKTIVELSKKKTTTVFTDGDRGGELILKELLQTCDVDYIARAPHGREVEELSKKEIVKCLRSKIPVEQVFHPGSVIKDDILGSIAEESQDNINHISHIENSVETSCQTGEKKCTPAQDIAVSEPVDRIKTEKTEKNKFDNIKSAVREVMGTSMVKVIINGDEEIKDLKDILNNIKNIDNMDFLVVDGPITQRIVDLLYGKTPLIVGREIKVTKKPVDLRLFSFDEILA